MDTVISEGGTTTEREPLQTVDEVCIAVLVDLAGAVGADGKSAEATIIAMARELGMPRPREASRARFHQAIQLAAARTTPPAPPHPQGTA
jgi:hypothetical protein